MPPQKEGEVDLEDEMSENGGEMAQVYWKKGLVKYLVPEFAIVISKCATPYHSLNLDERLFELIGDAYSLPKEAIDSISQIERDLFDKFADHERRVWGELDPNALTKYKI